MNLYFINLYFYHKNHLGSIMTMTDSNGNLAEKYKYARRKYSWGCDIFGTPKIWDNSTNDWEWFDSPLGNTRLYTGREYNKYTKLYYNRARYYSPELGRFISRDPIDISDDVNLYSYVGNNPVGFVDLMGLEKDLITERLILSIFDLAMENTGGFNIYQIYYGTKNSGPYDIKRNSFILTEASKNEGTINFNGVKVEPSNLGNLLFGMNTKNNYIPSFIARDILMDVEIDNATRIEGYGIYGEEIAKWDENSDEIRYDKGENIYSQYGNATTIDEKINIITQAIIDTNPEYEIRSKIELEKRKHYTNLLNN